MIKIGDDWGIIASSKQFSVCKKTIDKKSGEEYYAPKTYHTSIQDALKSLARRIDRLSLIDEDMSLNEAIRRLEDNHMKLKVLIESAIPDIEVKVK